jgi:hypothetical protein
VLRNTPRVAVAPPFLNASGEYRLGIASIIRKYRTPYLMRCDHS